MIHPSMRCGWERIVPLLLATTLLAGLTEPARAQPRAAPEYVLSQWNVGQGLPVNSVIAMVRRSDGVLWLATLDGLVRFDGSRFTVFSAATTPELPSNRLAMLFTGPKRDLWTVTEQGEVVRFADGRFTHVDGRYGLRGRHVPTERVEPSTTLIFPTTAGTGLYQPDADTVVMTTGLGFEPHVTHALPGGAYWVGGPGGHLALVDSTGGVHHAGPHGPLRDDVLDLHRDRRGTLWILTYRTLLRHTDAETVVVRDADGAAWVPGENTWMAEDPAGRMWVVDRPDLSIIQDDRAVGVAADTISLEAPVPEALRGSDGHLWTYGQTSLYRDGREVLETDGALINMILFDPDRSVWVATSRGGLMHLRPTPIRTYGEEVGLPDENIYPVLADARGNVWVGTMDYGLGCYGDACPNAASPMPGIFAFHEEEDGTLWAGGYGLYRLETDRFAAVSNPFPFEVRIRAIYKDRSGSLWVGSEGGLARGRARADGSLQFDDYTTANGLTHDWVRLLTETRDGTLWAGTSGGGLMRIRHTPSLDVPPRFEAFTEKEGLCSNNVRHLYEDDEGILWIATEDRGLCRVELSAGAPLSEADVRVLQSRHGLFDNALHHVTEDDFGRMWMSSNRGLFWVPRSALNAVAEGTSERVFSTVYTERNGLRNREFNGGVQPSGTRDASGRLWFPTQDGLVSIDPGEVVLPASPTAFIEDLFVGDESMAIGSGVTLSPNQRDIRISYGAAYYGDPDALWFRYRLRPYDTEWRYATTERTAAYTNLEPGSYTFEVSAGSGGEWQAEPAVLSLARRPHFHETRWFFALVLLGAVCGAFALHAARLRGLQRHRDLLEREVAAATHALTKRNDQLQRQNQQLRVQESQLAEQSRQLMEMDEVKTRFFANTSHELRTPLTLMLEPIRELRSESAERLPDAVQATLDLVHRNGLRLRRLVNQMLDLSRLEAGGMQLDVQPADLVPFLRRQVAAFESSARVKGLTLAFTSECDALSCPYDAEAMEKVTSNLLSNAIKFTPEGGHVELFVGSGADGTAEIRVTDTGPGIPADAIERIFDRFYQAHGTSTRHYEGSGIGLALARELILLHGGSIRADSEPGGGAVFTVTLPDAVVSEAAQTESLFDVTALLDEPRPAAGRDVHAGPAADGDADETVVLVVEDNDDMRAYLAGSLRSIGRVVLAKNGQEGVARAFGDVPDLIVSDVMMPESDGLELCTVLKEDRRTSHIPILLLTARADQESRLEGYDRGADAYLAKPFSKPELLARSRGLLANRQRLHDHFGRMSVLTLPDVEVSSHDARFLEDVTAALDEHLADSDFGVERLADAAAMSKRQLLRKLNALTGQSPSEMLRRLRLERAGALLRQDAGSVKEIAYAVGYRSTSSFRKAFSDYYGTSPSDFTHR